MRPHKRTFRWLDAALCRGAFDPEGSLRGLSATALAEFVVTDWRRLNDPTAKPYDVDDIIKYVGAWLRHNQKYIRRTPCET